MIYGVKGSREIK